MKKKSRTPRFKHGIIGAPKNWQRIKGCLDSRKGAETVDSRIFEFAANVAKKECGNCEIAESFLEEIREKSSEKLKSIHNAEDILASDIAPENDGTKESIRNVRRHNGRVSNAKEVIKTEESELCRNNEFIISTHSLLQQEILNIIKIAEEKIQAYVSGVRANIPEYEIPVHCDMEPYEKYIGKHRILDDAVMDRAYRSIEGGSRYGNDR